MNENVALTIDHVPSACWRYPGESVTLYTRVTVHQPLSGYELEITLPPGLELKGYHTPNNFEDEVLPSIYPHNGGWQIVLRLDQSMVAGREDEYLVQTVVSSTSYPTELESTARAKPLLTSEDSEESNENTETLSIAVRTKSSYLKYLPGVYETDDLMGRFLMLFESFWNPIDKQANQVFYYLDPDMAPRDLLPWLATWVNLVLDERWEEHKQRQLLSSAVFLYRRRGTRRGLEEYLEIYTGVRPKIIEHRASNFELGPDAHLGLGIALGTRNVPHTFSVYLQLPALNNSNDLKTAQREEQKRRQVIESIIEAEKPAHTAYTLHLEILEPDATPSQ